MRKNKNNLFKEVPIRVPKRNMFDLSHEVKLSMKFGKLYPVLLMDCLPGDTVRDQMTAMLRFAPMLAPIMHRVDVTTHFFFVPNRIITDHWENFITGGREGTDATILPFITPFGIDAAGGEDDMQKRTLWDYFGLPVAPSPMPASISTESISALPFRAFGKIFNDYYRDPNVSEELNLDVQSQGDVSAATYSAGLLAMRERGWEKDYFTSALPWAQRGAEVLMPLSGVATSSDVTYLDQSILKTDTGTVYNFDALVGTTNPPGGVAGGLEFKNDMPTVGVPGRLENIDEIEFTQSQVSINDFRTALAIQSWMENQARGGARYTETILTHFAERVPDFRLQRAEYLGGGKQPVQISEVLATTGGETDPPVGDMFGHGLSVGKSNRFTYRCQEHGWVLGIMSVMPKPSYDLGIERMWIRRSRFDFAWPELAHLGEQEILSQELFFSFDQDDQTENHDVFGYIPRYSEYKFKNDRFVGDFRDTLDFWHLGRIFSERPSLDNVFLAMFENGGAEETFRRIFAVQDGSDYIWCQLYHQLTARRPLPYFGVPKLIG